MPMMHSRQTSLDIRRSRSFTALQPQQPTEHFYLLLRHPYR